MNNISNFNNNNIGGNGVQHVAPVAPVVPVAPSWPPTWLLDLELPLQNPAASASNPADTSPTTSRCIRGWRLPSGVVLCGTCFPCPPGAVAVTLAQHAEGPVWVEVQQSGSAPAATLPAAPRPAENSVPNPVDVSAQMQSQQPPPAPDGKELRWL